MQLSSSRWKALRLTRSIVLEVRQGSQRGWMELSGENVLGG